MVVMGGMMRVLVKVMGDVMVMIEIMIEGEINHLALGVLEGCCLFTVHRGRCR